MRAIVSERYGRIELREVERPTPGEGEVLIRVRAAAINPFDFHMLRGKPFVIRPLLGGRAALRRPAQPIPGVDVAGVVEAVGDGVTDVAPGDEVFGGSAGSCAEYARAKAKNLAPKPERLTFEEASGLGIAALTALQAVRDQANVQPGQRVLINGAAGGIGTFAVQIAKTLGAEVTGVCSTRNVELVHSLGADRVVDYTQDDFTRNGGPYDVILDNVSNRSFRELRRVLTPTGTLIPNGGGIGLRRIITRTAGALILDRLTSRRYILFIAKWRKSDLLALKELVDEGKVTPVVDRTYPLGETAEALDYLEAEHARGKVVITPER